MENSWIDPPGKLIVLNGTPRAGKSSIAQVIRERFPGTWMTMGVDSTMAMVSSRQQPALGLRPGGERPDLEPLVEALYLSLYESMAAFVRRGINVVADTGHHDDYSGPLEILPRCAALAADLPAWFIGVRCPLPVIMERRQATWGTGYDENGAVPLPIQRWQEAVHIPGIYDLEVDTSLHTAEECAALIEQYIEDNPPMAFRQLALPQQE